MGWHELHAARQGDDPQQVSPYCAGVIVCEGAQEQRPFSALLDTLELPGQISDERVPLAAGQRDEGHNRTWRVTGL